MELPSRAPRSSGKGANSWPKVTNDPTRPTTCTMKSWWMTNFQKYMCNCVYVYNIFQALGEAVTEKKLLTGRPSGSKLVNFQTKGTGTSTSSSSSSVMSWRFQQQSNGWKSSDFQDPSNFKDYRNMFNDEKTLVKLKRSRESWTFWWLLFFVIRG